MSDRPALLQKELDKLLSECFTRTQLHTMAIKQHIEMRRFFFAGAKAFSSLLLENVSEGDDPAASDMALLQALQTELANFGKDVTEGRA
ncbi:hypothetical protein ASE63_08315 [Bosea sp. Root381]|uniref:hypothetical protein n=1 Tax=Bosea sp. Root381 TaxID=1736524 RepID=UPI0006F62006|nr:hypothetical protein [Bosea sp. Root381]KRE00095.1 hypothetical protein ASE63_08315 [Bosea sp. Root381]